MCIKYHAYSGDVSMAIKRDGGYPVNIFNGSISVDVENERELDRSLDFLESGDPEEWDGSVPEDWDPVYVVTHYEKKELSH